MAPPMSVEGAPYAAAQRTSPPQNFAPTDFGASSVIAHSAPAQSSTQPPNVAPASGRAASVTLVPNGNFASHVPGQSMPVGVDVTRPAWLRGSETASAMLRPTHVPLSAPEWGPYSRPVGQSLDSKLQKPVDSHSPPRP